MGAGVGEGVGALFWKCHYLPAGSSAFDYAASRPSPPLPAPPPGNAPHSQSPRILVWPPREKQRCADWPREPLVPKVGRDAPGGGACWGQAEMRFLEA